MTVRKVLCALAAGVFISLLSTQAVSACPNEHSSHLERKTISRTDHKSAAPPGDHKEQKPRLSNSHTQPSTRVGSRVSVMLQGGFEEILTGRCIHGCPCNGFRSHRRGCGSAGDCHAHPGLLCTWAL